MKIPHPERPVTHLDKLHYAKLCNSISDHMYRMAMLALCAEDNTLDIAK
jgi:hypothetical protein